MQVEVFISCEGTSFFRSTIHAWCVKLLLMKVKLLSVSLKHVMLVLHPADFLEMPWKFIVQNV